MIKTIKQLPARMVVGPAILVAIFAGIAIFAISSYPRDMEAIFVDSSVESMQSNLSASIVYANESIEANYSDVLILQDMLATELSGDSGFDDKTFAAMGIVKERGQFDRIGIMRADSDLLFATMSDGTIQQLDMWTLDDEVPLGDVSIEMQTSPFQTADGGYDAIVYRSRFLSATGVEYMLIAEKGQETLDKLLSVGQTTDGLSLVVRDNGNVVYNRGSLDGERFASYNLFAYLNGLGASQESIDSLSSGIVNQQSGTIDFALNQPSASDGAQVNGSKASTGDYTFIYHRIENTNWVCVQGYSKKALAGSNLQTVNSKTMNLVALVAVLLCVVLASVAIIGIHRAKEEGERESLEREHLFEEMSRHIPSAIVILEDDKPEPRFLSFNFNEVVPIAPKSFSGTDVAEWAGASLSSDATAKYDKEGHTVFNVEQKGRTLNVRSYSLGVINNHDYNVMIITDISEAVESRKLLEASMHRADEASRSKSSFLSSMSHEIRTPLNAVLGFSKLALNKWDTASRDELYDYIAKIQTSGNYLLELVSDILDISRIEEGRMEISTAPMPLQDLIGEVRDSFQGQMASKGIDYVVEENFEPIVLDMDAFHVRQVLNNLVSNACKYTEEGGTVRFSTSLTKLDANKASVRFEVKDSGIGMTPEFLEKIFDPFTMEDRGSQMKKQLRGSGLGMSICKNLVDMQGGTIAVDSELGKGSRFVVQMTFDIVGEGEDRQGEGEELDATCLAGARVLIADDVELNRVVLEDFLEDYDVEFDEVENGQEALDKFKESEPGAYLAVFMDGRMPVMDGYEATMAIRALDRADAKTTPIIAMTAEAFSDDVNHAIMCGMSHHVTKPIDFDKVLGILVGIRTGKE